jgi:COMPASS component SWD1
MGPLAWHPARSCLCSVTRPSGRVYVWARAYAEQWSAFAPDFKELEENIEYCEQEDEFDWATPVSHIGSATLLMLVNIYS